MTRSIFDPTGNPEHSGTRFTPPDAGEISQMPDQFKNPPSAVEPGIVDFVPEVERPAINVSSEAGGKLLMVTMTGKLHKRDYQAFVPVVEQAVRKHGKLRMVVEMNNFHGWDAGALWEDIKFDAKHFNDIERIAIIGDAKWEKWMATFCNAFTTATVRFFPPGEAADARLWIMSAVPWLP